MVCLFVEFSEIKKGPSCISTGYAKQGKRKNPNPGVQPHSEGGGPGRAENSGIGMVV